MSMLHDVHLDDPLFINAFDFSRYLVSRIRAPGGPKPHDRGRSLFTVYNHGSPSGADVYQPPRNVSEPRLTSSTNHRKESWFMNIPSSHTAGDDDIPAAIPTSHSTTLVHDTAGAYSPCGVDDLQAPYIICEDPREASGNVEPNTRKSDKESLYSQDSADQDAHPLLLSMPIIPQIKLERKATVRKPDYVLLSDTAQNQDFLSPRIRDLRTPARISSRRNGHLLTSPLPVARGARVVDSNSHGSFFFQACRRIGSASWRNRMDKPTTKVEYTRSASEPVLNSSYTSDNEEEPLLKRAIDEPPRSDISLSMIEDSVDSTHEAYSDGSQIGIPKPIRRKQVPLKHAKPSHRRSSLRQSVSISNIIHAVTDGCTSPDHPLHKPKTKPQSTITTEPDEPPPHGHDSTSKWAPNQGYIVIKVFVPSTNDIWMFRVPQDISLSDFTSKVVAKLGFPISFSGSLWDEPKYYFRTDERFKSWVKGRVRFGRNLPIVAHVPASLPLMKLGVQSDSCEVWCRA